MVDVPLIAPAVVVLAIAALEWRSSRVVAWAALAAGFVLLAAALAYPGFTAAQVLSSGHSAVAYALAAARPIALACLLGFAVRRLRETAA